MLVASPNRRMQMRITMRYCHIPRGMVRLKTDRGRLCVRGPKVRSLHSGMAVAPGNWGCGGRAVWVCYPASLTNQPAPGSIGDSTSKNKVERDRGRLIRWTSDFHTYSHRQVQLHTHVHTYVHICRHYPDKTSKWKWGYAAIIHFTCSW